MNDPYNMSTIDDRESSASKTGDRVGAGKVGGFFLRGARYVIGVAPPAQSGRETPWSEYAVDLIMWAAVVAAAGVMVYLVYPGIHLFHQR